MFILISKNYCPSCGVVGKIWNKKLKIFICPVCNTIFNEFGFVTIGTEKEMLLS